MATVQSTLKLFDSMTRPLQNITQGMNMMISTMQQMQAAADHNVNIDKTLAAAKNKIADAEAEIMQSIEQANAAQQKFNRSVQAGQQAAKSSESAFSKLGASVIVLNQGLELAQKAFEKVKEVMTFSDEIASANAKLGMMTDSLRTQGQLQQQVLDVANRTRQSYSATADLMTKLGMGTQGVFKNNDEMLAFSERFNKTLVASGATAQQSEAAILQMSQALGSGVLQGDELRSISEQAPKVLQVIADGLGVARGELKKMGADGKLTADQIVKAFQNQTDKIDTMFGKMPVTFGQSMTLMQNKMAAWVGKLNSAEGPLQKITKSVQDLVAWMDSPNGAKLLTALSIGLSLVASGFSFALHAAMGFMDFFSAHWPEITAAALILALFYVPMLTASLWEMLIPVYQAVAAWLALNWPIVLVIGAVIALIAILRYFGVTTQQMVGSVVGVLYMLYAVFQNTFALIYNILLSVVEFLANLFIDPVYAIQKLFFDLSKNIADYFWSAINGIIKGINWITQAINKIADTEIGIISTIDTSAIDKFKPTTNKDVFDLSKYRLQQTDYGDAFNKGYSTGAGAVDQMSGFLDKLNVPGEQGTNIDKVGSVGSVGKIDDKVDISSEDLKVMRDLAEMKAIQNFVTLTPTVNVTTGPVTKETDVDEIIRRIGEHMDQEIESSAQDVYDL